MSDLSDNLFEKFIILINEMLGIRILKTKKLMIQSRIDKHMKILNLSSYEDYYKLINNKYNIDERKQFANYITTNTTKFFREIDHFIFLKDNLKDIITSNKQISQHKKINLWCTASSTGQEPYSLAMLLDSILPYDIDFKILATDINTEVLSTAKKGVYSIKNIVDVPSKYIDKYFQKYNNEYEIKDYIKSKITFRQFNLKDDFHFSKSLDIIFCRNVMIYLDNDTIDNLVNNFNNILSDNGLLFVGHSESIISRNHNLKLIANAVYKK